MSISDYRRPAASKSSPKKAPGFPPPPSRARAQATETVIIARCIGCEKTREIRAFEVEPDSMPVCDECFMPMIATKAVQKPIKP